MGAPRIAEEAVSSANASMLRAIGKYIAAGKSLAMHEQLAAIGLLAAESEAREGQRLWDAHHRKFKYTPMKQFTYPEGSEAAAELNKNGIYLRREMIDTKRYTGADIRAAEAKNGCGKRKPLDTQPRTRMYLPWHEGTGRGAPRIIAYTIVKRPDNSVERFDNIRIFRGANGHKQRRDLRLERSLTDGQWIVLVKALTVRVLS